jgi:hypothetical protein
MSIQNLEWRNLNSLRRHPFTDGSSLFFDGGALPTGWILDARVYPRGQYQAEEPCRIGRLIRAYDAVVLELVTGSVVVGTARILLGGQDSLITVLAGAVPAGCLVVDPARTQFLQAIDEGEYELPPGTADFLSCCVEAMPYPQVTSLGGASGDVLLSASEGISLTRVDSSTLRVDIVGDPHPTRYDCIQEEPSSEGNQALDLQGTFLQQLTVVHYVKNAQGQLVGPFASRLQSRPDGSIALVLRTQGMPDPLPAGTTALDFRPAFRITVEDNSLVFSMAGG